MTRVRLGDAFALNPTVTIARGVVAPFVEMAALQPFTRDVRTRASKSFSSGMKFLDGDVLMARITPSLENGKTSIYRASPIDLKEAAFGSTEFIVVRGRDGVSDSTFAFYLLTSPEIREFAISQMNGSSGRQRVQHDAFAAYKVQLPPLEEQREIAATLGALDDKIESNRRAMGLIDELLMREFQSLVRRSEVSEEPLSNHALITNGVSYRSIELQPSRTSLVTLKSFDRAGGYKADGLKPYVGPFKPQQVVEPGELVVARTDLTQGAEVVGRAVRVPADLSADKLVASLDLVIVRPLGEMPAEYLQGILMDESFRQYCRSRTSGTTVLHLASDAIPTYRAPIISASAQREYQAAARPLIARVDSLRGEIEKLTAMRDGLLPDLLAGRIRVLNAGDKSV